MILDQLLLSSSPSSTRVSLSISLPMSSRLLAGEEGSASSVDENASMVSGASTGATGSFDVDFSTPSLVNSGDAAEVEGPKSGPVQQQFGFLPQERSPPQR